MARATRDGFGRRITYMRLSITDRCNLCCGYCRPRAAHPLTQEEGDVLSFDELCEIAVAGVELGITRYKVTGGEPLVRGVAPSWWAA